MAYTELERVTLDFVTTAPYHMAFQARLEAPPSVVFDRLADTATWPRWFVDLRSARYLDGRDGGLGARREVQLKLLTARERFVAWEPGRRFAFVIEALSLPLVSAMLEDWVLTEDGSSTRVCWTIYYRPRWLMRLVHPFVRALFARIFRRSLSNLADHVRSA